METYRSSGDAVANKADLGTLMVTLDASPSSLRRDDRGLWVLQGSARLHFNMGRRRQLEAGGVRAAYRTAVELA